MKTVKNKFKKEIIKELPRALFDGRIEVIKSAEESPFSRNLPSSALTPKHVLTFVEVAKIK